MSVIDVPASTARQTGQRDNIERALIKGGIEPATARIVSESVSKRLAHALQGPDITVHPRADMPLADVAEQLDAFAVALTAPLLAEIVKLEMQLCRANEALTAAAASGQRRPYRQPRTS